MSDQQNFKVIGIVVIALLVVIMVVQLLPWIIKWAREHHFKPNYKTLGESSRIRLVHQINDAVVELSRNKVGAIISIINKDTLDNYRTDGVKLDANISSALILAIFNKNSPLHDGAIIIQDNKIKYAATYYRITSKSISNRFGARHRAALGISESTDALTIVVSETSGAITFTLKSKFVVVNLVSSKKS
ncbi:diadenylate cyclase [Mycoplasma sp. ATU-Cv-508]|uniref:diadenylate cyclase n=1 Tax=Mycoplasma sp. ATU-Cv-508 TaxID=2048001 RepID=UPI001F196D1E